MTNMLLSLIEPVLMGISLAMDALAVSIALGAVERGKFNWGKILATAFSFGLFQFLMPLTGWFGGGLCGSLVQVYGRCIACALLTFLGGKMIVEAIKRKADDETIGGFRFGRLIVLSFATSIDALLVGVGYACLARASIWLDISVIGIVTFVISACGCLAGRFFGNLFGHKCDLAGGIVLICIAIKVLIFG